MKRMAAMLGVVIVLAAGWTMRPVAAQENPATPEFYTQRVRPILQANCARCHGAFNRRAGLNIDTREGMLKGGQHGAALVPGDSANSLLIKLIRHEGPTNDPMAMPPRGKLSDADIAVVEQWVKAGAIMPPDSAR